MKLTKKSKSKENKNVKKKEGTTEAQISTRPGETNLHGKAKTD